jgi:hypothetical protein
MIMNKYLLLSFFALGLFFNTTAQSVNEQKVTMSLGPQNCYLIAVEGADKALLESAWKDYTKEFGKTKANKKAKEIMIPSAKVPLINGSAPLTLHSKFEDGKGEGTAYLWVDLGGAFANSSDHKSQSAGIETFMKDFWIVARKKAVGKELEAEEKKLSTHNKDLKKLEDKKKDLLAEIEKCKQKILEAEKGIEVNGTDQIKKQDEIELQKRTVQQVVDKLNAVGKTVK